MLDLNELTQKKQIMNHHNCHRGFFCKSPLPLQKKKNTANHGDVFNFGPTQGTKNRTLDEE